MTSYNLCHRARREIYLSARVLQIVRFMNRFPAGRQVGELPPSAVLHVFEEEGIIQYLENVTFQGNFVEGLGSRPPISDSM